MRIDPSHPRATSLRIRERLVWGVQKGITSTAGLLAHGRGEAFDYLLGEKTHDYAKQAIKAAAATLLLAKQPVLSINGNAAALCAREFIELARLLRCKIEVNLFHFSKTRVKTIERHLKTVVGTDSDALILTHAMKKATLPNIASPRKTVIQQGIAAADVVFVPLEDGDRCEALIRLGKKIVTVDLNPLSRTAQKATITIIDNITRALPLLISEVTKLQQLPHHKLVNVTTTYKNTYSLREALKMIMNGLAEKAKKNG